MKFSKYLKLNKNIVIRNNDVCQQIVKMLNRHQKEFEIVLDVGKNDGFYHPDDDTIHVPFNALNKTFWHEIGHYLFRRVLEKGTRRELMDAIIADIANISNNNLYVYDGGELSDAYKILTGKKIGVNKTQRHWGGTHEDGYGKLHEDWIAATETFAELFACLMTKTKGNQKLPLYSRAFRKAVGELYEKALQEGGSKM